MKKFGSLILAGLVAGMFSSGTATAADPEGDDVETIGTQIESEAGVPVSEDKGPGHPPEGGHDLEAIGKQTNNPVGAAWMMWFQNDFTVMDGDKTEHEENWNSLKFQPVMSFNQMNLDRSGLSAFSLSRLFRVRFIDKPE